MAINFNQAGSFNGVTGEAQVLNNPTSIQFGPDGRLYVAEQNGTINAFTVEIQNDEYVATANEELLLANNAEAVKSIQNHNDDGSLSNQSNRQVTGLIVTGTAENPVLYVSSSDPRIATFEDPNLDTNSGVVTQLTWNGTEWEAVDIVRGLPRSEENHSVNGMELSADGTKLYLMVGGNTNNGAPSDFFAYTGEYALSGTVLEIDLEDIASRPVLTDPLGGQDGTSRQYVYDLPTLDDPTITNNSDGIGEDTSGIDEAGPWGGNDGLNMAILPADAPMRIFADGLRNQYDIELTENGQFYTVDNGSNGTLGGNPLDANGNPTDEPGAGEATNTPNNGGTGDPEPLFLLEDGGYYGHPAPPRSNQDLPWTVYDDDGNPDATLTPNSVGNLANLVPDGVNIADGFLIDPSKFTDDPERLAQSGIRIERDSADSNALITLGSSSNGLVEYTDDVFEGALQGSLIVTQFNGNITLLNLSDDATSIEPLIDPTEGNEVIDDDGIFPLATGQSNPLDVTTGPDGTIWVAELGPDNINVFAPSGEVEPTDSDFDEDGIVNADDPFLRDESNGGSVLVLPGQDLLWDFDADQDGNLPGPDGYGGGLTGVMIDGDTDFEEFFQEPSTLPGQIVKLDNVKFNTAAGGGTTVIESVSNGDPFQTPNNGEYLFHTGVTLASTVETFNIKWSVFNPGTEFTGSFQQIGGYIGTGDQSNYLKIVAIEGLNNEVQILLEDNDVVQSQSLIQAEDLLSFPTDQQIFFELEIDPIAGTAIPTVSWETGDDNIETATGETIDLSGTAVLDAIQGNYTVNGQDSGLAVGLFSSNNGEPAANAFQAIFNDVEITATGDVLDTVLYRVNAGGGEIAAIDGGIAWSADTVNNNSSFLVDPGSNSTASFPAVEPGTTVPAVIPDAIYDTERWDLPNGTEMQWAFDVPEEGLYEVRLYMGNGFDGTSQPGERIFDVAIEGSVPEELDDIDLSEQFGHETGGVINNTVNVTDGTIDIEFIHGAVENPLVNGIEIVQLGENGTSTSPTVSLVGSPYVVSEDEGQVQISLLTDVTVPSEETVEVTFEIVPGTATALDDYEYLSDTATFDEQTGIYTDTVAIAGSSSDATFSIDILADAIAEGDEAFTVNITDVSTNAQIGTDSASVTIEENDSTSDAVLYRVNAGGTEIAATDGDLAWSADTVSNNSPFLVDPGSNNNASFAVVEPGASVPAEVPDGIYDTERWDQSGGSEMQWAFDVPEDGLYEVRLYMGNGFDGTSEPGERIFDVAIEGSIPDSLDDIDLSEQFGHETGGVINNTVNVTDGTIDIEFIHGAAENPLVNGIEIVQLGDDSDPSTSGAAVLTVTADSNNVQASNFGSNSFEITNTGDKKIAQVELDVTNALYPDTVFDPFGQAGDTVSKELTIDTNGSTGVVATSNDSYLGTGGTAGFEAIQLTFDENDNGGFESGETVGFSVDMDPNSVAGANKSPLDEGSNPPWDVGGVSGAELIGSTFTVTYDDGTTATGQLQGAGNQAGSQALATQDTPDTDTSVSLTVNNLDPGGVGTYAQNDFSVIVNGTAGQTARVVLTKGFIQPTSLDPFLNGTAEQQEFAPVLQSQLDALAASDFPANNAVEFQTVDVQLTGEDQDITELFDFSNVSAFDFEGEDRLPLGFVASAIDPTNDNLPIGSVTQPIYLQFEEDTEPVDSETTLYRVNAGGAEIAATDGDIAWSADTVSNNSSFLVDAGSNNTASFPDVVPGASVPEDVPDAIYDTERWDQSGGSEMQWAFDVPEDGLYEVRLYMGNGFDGTSEPGERIFDVAIEGSVPDSLNDIDLSEQFGHEIGGVFNNTVTVTDGTLNIEFIHGVENPLVNGIEIVQLDEPII